MARERKEKLDKQEMVNRIMDVLDVEKEDVGLLAENLNKMSKPALDVLLDYMETTWSKSEDTAAPEETNQIKRIQRSFPKSMMPHDVVNNVKNPGVMNDMLAMLPEVGRTIAHSFLIGDFPELKRSMGVNNRITHECEKMVSKQLWDAVKMVHDISDIAETSEPVD